MDALGEIRAARERLVRQREMLLAEAETINGQIAALDTTLRILSTKIDATWPVPHEQDVGQGTQTKRGVKQARIKKILSERYPEGLNAAEINSWSRDLFGEEINPNTLTVTLGRMRNKGLVRIEGRTWFFVPQNEEAAETPSTASPAASSTLADGGPLWNRLSDDTNPPPGEREN
jgi:hypothetical protein